MSALYTDPWVSPEMRTKLGDFESAVFSSARSEPDYESMAQDRDEEYAAAAQHRADLVW